MFITGQKGSRKFAIPTVGTPQLLHYSEVACGDGQHFLNVGGSDCDGVGNSLGLSI